MEIKFLNGDVYVPKIMGGGVITPKIPGGGEVSRITPLFTPFLEKNE